MVAGGGASREVSAFTLLLHAVKLKTAEMHKTIWRGVVGVMAEPISLQELSAHGHVHLRGSNHVGTNQVQVSEAGVAIGLFRVQKIQERRTAVLIRKTDPVSIILGEREI